MLRRLGGFDHRGQGRRLGDLLGHGVIVVRALGHLGRHLGLVLRPGGQGANKHRHGQRQGRAHGERFQPLRFLHVLPQLIVKV